jgi:hypothetical protein
MSYKKSLPNVELPSLELKKGKLYVTLEGEKRQITKFSIIANGLKDLCCCLDEDGNVVIKKITSVSPERRLYIPQHDILWLELRDPIVKKRVVFFEISETIKKFVDILVKIFGGQKACDYEMYGGENYG